MDKKWCIYKITFPNKKYYIGQTYNFNKRVREHLNDMHRYNYKIYKAMRKYNITNENFSIIEDNINNINDANKQEQYWINYYDSFNNGYNSTLGGDSSISKSILGESHPRAKITNEELYNIRKLRYSKQFTLTEVYEQYKDKCSKSGFIKLWNYESRKNIGQEFDIAELRDFYRIDTRNRRGEIHKNCKISDLEVQNIRKRYFINGEKSKDIYKDYSNIYSYSGFTKLIFGESHKHIETPEQSLKCVKKLPKLTDEEVIHLRTLYKQGKSIKELHIGKYLKYNISNFKYMLEGKTYKHIN